MYNKTNHTIVNILTLHFVLHIPRFYSIVYKHMLLVYRPFNLARLARAKLLNLRTHICNVRTFFETIYAPKDIWMGMWQSSHPISFCFLLSFVMYWSYNGTLISRVCLTHFPFLHPCNLFFIIRTKNKRKHLNICWYI